MNLIEIVKLLSTEDEAIDNNGDSPPLTLTTVVKMTSRMFSTSGI